MSFNPDDYWKQFEDMLIENYPIEAENIIYDLLKFYEKDSSQKFEEMKKEQKLLNIFIFSVQSHVWEWCVQNPNKPLPEWKTEDISYYKSRKNTTLNPLRKARYAYAIWTVEKKDIEEAKSSIENFMKTVDIYGEKNDLDFRQYQDMEKFFEISKKLALSLHLLAPHDAKSIFQKIYLILEKQNLIAKHKIGVCSTLITLLQRCASDLLNSKYAKDQDILQILHNTMSLLDGYANESRQKSNLDAEINFLKKKLELAKVIKSDELIKSIKLTIAQLLEKRADQDGNSLVHSMWLQDVAKIYYELGMTDKVEGIAKQCEFDVKKAIETGEFKEVQVFSATIKTGEIADKYKKQLKGKNVADILLQITLDDNMFIPNWQQVYTSTQNASKQHPLGNLFQRIEFTDTLPSRHIEDDEKKLVLDANKSFIVYSSVGISIFGEIIKCLLDSKQVEKKGIVDFLKASTTVESDDMLLIEKAICYYIDGDHVAFSHVIVPRIEQMMRAVIKKRGGSAITYDSQESGFDQRLMGGLIRELQPLIDEDFYKHLDVWLGQDGQNVRNKISHGWMKYKDFKEQLSDMLLYTILRLSMA